jgi:hypothetical protein
MLRAHVDHFYERRFAMDAKFLLGRTVATPGAITTLQESGQAPEHFLDLHVSGNWGDIDAHDRKCNDDAIAHEGNPDRQQRVLSAYVTKNNVKLWVITEWDRSVTTILLPDEY